METNQNNQLFTRIMKLITARWISEPLYVAAKLGIADLLANGPQTIHELAVKTGSHEPYLLRVLRALASIGIFRETGNKIYENSPLSACLKTESMHPLIMFFFSDWHNRAWGNLYESVKTGKNAFQMAHRMPAFQWLANHPDEARVFHQANTLKIKNLCTYVLNSYDFSHIHSITDIGGSAGTLLIEILKAHPHVKGRIADLPIILDAAKKNILDHKLENRCTVCECDFFKAIPKGSDLYLMSNILHDWDDGKCTNILKNCRKVMKKHTILLILEMIVAEKNEPSIAALLDLEVLVMGGGKERTLDEFHTLLGNTGFNINKIIDVGDNEKIIECRCVE